MNGKKIMLVILITMSLLMALGAWAMVDGAIAYRNRTLIEERASGTETLSFEHNHQIPERYYQILEG